jgi:hypothetical protein
MPAFSFAANAATDQITIAGHGLVTGDGPAAVRNVGGALPGGLVALTDYWVIRVDANTLKLATSNSNALAGTAIDLTTTGSGTNLLEIGIPYRRPRTYVAGVSQIKSADLNANFDSWSSLHALLTGQSQSLWSGVNLAVPLSLATEVQTDISLASGRHASVAGTGRYKHGIFTKILPSAAFVPSGANAHTVSYSRSRSGVSNVNGEFEAPISLPVGKRIREVRVKLRGAPGAAVGIDVIRLIVESNTFGALGASLTLTGSGLFVVGAIGGLTQPVSLGETLSIVVTISGITATVLHSAEVDYDEP